MGTSKMDNTNIISIHAPSRERRSYITPERIFIGFQSTLPRGSDWLMTVDVPFAGIFQSTLPRGSDRLTRYWLIWTAGFQSTLPRGSDVYGFLA